MQAAIRAGFDSGHRLVSLSLLNVRLESQSPPAASQSVGDAGALSDNRHAQPNVMFPLGVESATSRQLRAESRCGDI